jgi:dTDP-4-amino-4,6-dideoxy-D-galactose acyltransferase
MKRSFFTVREPCDLLPWDSDFFGLRIARVRVPHLGPEEVSQVSTWCQGWHIDCAYFLASGKDPATLRRAQEGGYRMVDVRVSLSADLRSLRRRGTVRGVRLHNAMDRKPILELSRKAFRDSRFYRDGNFPRQRCDALYETWARKSCEGWARAVFVTGRHGNPEGFITCHLDRGKAGRIGLIAVEPRARGNGVGSQLVEAALQWFAEKGATRASVVTQGGNTSAIRLYEKTGFRSDSLNLWYHFWPGAQRLVDVDEAPTRVQHRTTQVEYLTGDTPMLVQAFEGL